MPVTSFAAEFLELYRRAAQEEIRVTLATPAAAKRLRARLHSLRVALRDERHDLRTIAEGVQISIEDSVLIAKPSDDNFIEALQAAGIVIEEPRVLTSLRDLPVPEDASHPYGRLSSTIRQTPQGLTLLIRSDPYPRPTSSWRVSALRS